MEQFLKGTEWQLVEEMAAKPNGQYETLFALSNGHLGTRGTREESFLFPWLAVKEGTYVNRFYETRPIQYGESAYGYAKNHQTICELPNGKALAFALNGEWFGEEGATVREHNRTLDLEKGTLTRTLTWQPRSGGEVRVTLERLVSFAFPEILSLRCTLEMRGCAGELRFENYFVPPSVKAEEDAVVDPRVSKRVHRDYTMRLEEGRGLPVLRCQTVNSGLNLYCGQLLQSENADVVRDKMRMDGMITLVGTSTQQVVEDGRYVFEIHNYYGEPFSDSEGAGERAAHAAETLREAASLGFDELRNRQERRMEAFWRASDILIEGDELLQKGLRFNLFHLFQAAGRNGKTNIPAKGLTGDGYEGHYFWDTEMYMLPFFIYTQPKIAKALVAYRHSILEQAQARARELNVESGAWYAWRTLNGEECSAYYPAGTAQVHINADIAYGVQTYVEVSGEEHFKFKEGLEILVETARFWLAFGDYLAERGGAFCINGVTGPDEYTALVNNNYYTNVMARDNLRYAARIAGEAQLDLLGAGMLDQLGVTDEEISEWQRAADAMYLGFDKERGLTKQDDACFDRSEWDFAGTPPEKHPLLLHYHPMMIYRAQVNKQADVVLAHFLQGEGVSLEQKRRDFDYYEKITTHDSSLSRSIFGIMASEIGDTEKAYHYFMDTALMDLTDIQGNTVDGIHAANLGGTWLGIVAGFAGMRRGREGLSFRPTLPEQWQGYSFSIHYQGRHLHVHVGREGTTYTLKSGEPLRIRHNDELVQLEKEGVLR